MRMGAIYTKGTTGRVRGNCEEARRALLSCLEAGCRRGRAHSGGVLETSRWFPLWGAGWGGCVMNQGKVPASWLERAKVGRLPRTDHASRPRRQGKQLGKGHFPLWWGKVLPILRGPSRCLRGLPSNLTHFERPKITAFQCKKTLIKKFWRDTFRGRAGGILWRTPSPNLSSKKSCMGTPAMYDRRHGGRNHNSTNRVRLSHSLKSTCPTLAWF